MKKLPTRARIDIDDFDAIKFINRRVSTIPLVKKSYTDHVLSRLDDFLYQDILELIRSGEPVKAEEYNYIQRAVRLSFEEFIGTGKSGKFTPKDKGKVLNNLYLEGPCSDGCKTMNYTETIPISIITKTTV